MPKIVIFVFVGIILLSGGSVALMMQMEIGPFANEEKKATVDSTPKDEKPEKKIAIETVTMAPLSIPIIQNGKIVLNLQLEIQIDTTKKKAPKLREKLPILKDAYVRDLFSFIPRQLRKSKKLDQETLRRRLRVVGQRTIGKGIIHAVNIKSYSEVKSVNDAEKEETTDPTTN